MSKCELCGSEVKVVGHTTKSYENITIKKLNSAIEVINVAKVYLESCGYHKLKPIDGEPEYQMWESFDKWLKENKKDSDE